MTTKTGRLKCPSCSAEITVTRVITPLDEFVCPLCHIAPLSEFIQLSQKRIISLTEEELLDFLSRSQYDDLETAVESFFKEFTA